MVLNSIFGDREADVSDEGYLSASLGSNLVQTSIITGDISEGAIISCTDTDLTTYVGTKIITDTSTTRYILIDFGKKLNKVNITVYYSVIITIPSSTTVTLQSSIDNSTWTDLDSVSRSASAGETFKNYSAQIPKLRYFRLKSAGTNTSGGDETTAGRIYNITASKK